MFQPGFKPFKFINVLKLNIISLCIMFSYLYDEIVSYIIYIIEKKMYISMCRIPCMSLSCIMVCYANIDNIRLILMKAF